MMKVIKLATLAIVLALATTGCGTTKIVNVPAQNVVKQMSQQEIHNAIYRAGVSRGWTMSDASGSVLHATYAKRGFTVTAAITYSPSAYSINYVSSQGLKYDPSTQTIHKNYNSWIANLKKQINMEIMLSNGSSAVSPAPTKVANTAPVAPTNSSSDEW